MRGTVAFFTYLTEPGNRFALRDCLKLLWNCPRFPGGGGCALLRVCLQPRRIGRSWEICRPFQNSSAV